MEGQNEPPVPAAEGNGNSTAEEQLNGSVPAGSDANGGGLHLCLGRTGRRAGVPSRHGTCTYTPPENFNGEVSFDYTVNDGLAPMRQRLSLHAITQSKVSTSLRCRLRRATSNSTPEDTVLNGSVSGWL